MLISNDRCYGLCSYNDDLFRIPCTYGTGSWWGSDETFTEEFMSKIVISTSPANGPPPLGATPSACKVVTNFSAHDIWNHPLMGKTIKTKSSEWIKARDHPASHHLIVNAFRRLSRPQRHLHKNNAEPVQNVTNWTCRSVPRVVYLFLVSNRFDRPTRQ